MKSTTKKELRVILAIILCITQICWFFAFAPTAGAANGLIFDDSGDAIKITNNYYEFAFNKSNGGITYIKDMSTGLNVSEGGNGGYLWYAAADSAWVGSTFGNLSFSYEWHPENGNQLVMHWAPNGADLDVKVYAYFSEDKWMKMTALVQNDLGSDINRFGFPVELKVKANSINDALLPMMPGAKLNSRFFREGKAYTAQYPGEMFADYVAVNSTNGKLAIFSEKQTVEPEGQTKVQPAYIGFEPSPEDTTCTRIFHDYKTSVKNKYFWQSPYVIMRVGENYQDTIADYRWAQGIGDYKALAEKLGDKKQQYFEAPMYKLDIAVAKEPFQSIQTDIIDRIRYPGLVHPVAFQENGHDNNYPDFVPPDTQWGTTQDFAGLVSYAQSRGNLVMPYTNFSWWDNEGPTLAGKTTDELKQYVSTWSDGTPQSENYGVNSGYVMDPNNSFVTDKIAGQHGELINTVGMDGIFEDQWGARAAPYDYNPAGISGGTDASTSYFTGVLNHAAAHSGERLMTEVGIDVLANDETGFMGTNYLWDIAGYRSATSPYTEYYPMAGMLLRDKVLLYQHDLAGETWTDDKNMFRWNLAQGYNFSGSFHVNDILDMDNPWLDLIGIFQKNVLSRYADKLVTGYESLDNKVTRTTFGAGEYTAYSNWSDKSTYTTPDADYTLPADGAMVQSADGTVTGGVFTAYNRHSLSDGDHYIVETRSDNEIKLYQPVGSDTDIFVNKPENWTGVKVEAFDYKDGLITTGAAITVETGGAGNDIQVATGPAIDVYAGEGDQICFNYKSDINGQKVAYYRLTQSESANVPLPGDVLKPDLVVTAVALNPADAAEGQPVRFNMTLMNQGTAAAVPVERTRPTDNVATKEYGGGFSVDGTWVTYTNVPLIAQSEIPESRSLAPGESIQLASAEELPWVAVTGKHTITAGIDDWLNFVVESNEGNNIYTRDIEIAGPDDEEPPLPPEVGPENARHLNIDIESEENLNAIWDSVVTNEVNKAVVGSSDPDFSGKFGTLWDADKLYLLAQVKDDITRADGDDTWQNDSVELYLDMNHNKGSSYGADDFQYRFAWSGEAVTTPEETTKGNVEGVSYKCIDTEEGYRIIAVLPWATLGKTPEAGMDIGFDVAMNDNDTGERATQIVWHSIDDKAWQYPDRFGTCILSAEEAAKPDLILTDIGWSPAQPVAGSSVTFNATVKNQGLAATPEGTVLGIGFQVDGAPTAFWSDAHTAALAVGDSVILPVNGGVNGAVWSALAGTHSVSATVDDVNRIPESNEGNNSFSKTISVGQSTTPSSGGGTPQTPAADDKKITPVLKGTTAEARADLTKLNKAFEEAKAGAGGVKTIQLEIGAVNGADEYLLGLPKEIFNTGDTGGRAERRIEIKTPAGTVAVPDNMFDSSALKDAKEVGISIGTADPADLAPEVRAAVGDRPVIELNALIDGKVTAWENADAPVTVSMDYVPTAGELENPDSIVVWYIDGNGKLQSVPTGKYDPATGKVTFVTTHFSRYAVAYSLKTFADTENYGWAEKSIGLVASKGILNGKSETAFEPSSAVTRAEFVDSLVKALGLTAKFDTNFEDINIADNYYKSVGIAKKLGITAGTGGGRFSPGAAITRQDMSMLTGKALELAGKLQSSGNAAGLEQFTDVQEIAPYAVNSMAALVREEILAGSGGKLKPEGEVTRAQAAVILAKVYNK